MNIVRGDRVISPKRVVYDVIQLGPRGDSREQYRLATLQSRNSRRKLYRRKWQLDYGWRRMPRYPRILALPSGA